MRKGLQTVWSWVLSADRHAAKWWPVLIPMVALAYYGLYFRHGLELSGEGGTNALYAQRLMEGQRPIADTFLGYNVGWFYPLVVLFQFTGPHYLVMRAFFFVLSTLSALIGAGIVRKVGGSGLLALGTGIVLVLIPGMIFRNYMGFLGVFTQLVLLWTFVWPVRGRWEPALRMGVAGAALAVTYLIRVEVGLLVTPVYAGLWLLGWLRPGEARLRWYAGLSGAALAAIAWGLVHLPVALDANRRGYAEQFWWQYEGMKHYLNFLLREKIEHLRSPETAQNSSGLWEYPTNEFNGGLQLIRVAAQGEIASPVAKWRPRPPVLEMFTGKGQRERYFAAAIYVPVLISAMLLLGGIIGLLAALILRKPGLWDDSVTALILLSGALALFPQYFFFRPDTPHLTEFMIPFLTAVTSVAGMLGARFAQAPQVGRGVLAGLGCIAVIVTVWLHFGHAWTRGSAGTIAARRQNVIEFRAENGVSVLVPPERAEELQGLYRAIVGHSKPDDFIVVFPYSPTVHLMTARRSYLYDIYMDDTKSGEWFEQDQIRQLIEKRPPVVVIDNRAVNKTEASRFRNWAPKITEFVERHYRLLGVFAGHEVFVIEGGAEPLPQPPAA